MAYTYKNILPTKFELWGIGLTSLGLLLAGNAQVFLERYGLIDSSKVVRDRLTGTVGNGLGVLDSFSVTPLAITFIIWAVFGLLTFSLVQAVVRASGLVGFERALGSNRYVHPQNFDRDRYWRRIIGDTAASFCLLTLLGLGAALYLLFVVPVGFSYTQTFLLYVSLPHVSDLCLGIFTVFAGTGFLYLLLKLMLWQRRRSQA